MNRVLCLAVPCLFLAASSFAAAPEPAKTAPPFQPAAVTTSGSVTAGGTSVSYDAVAGTLLVHAKDWDDTAAKDDKANPNAEASMFYAAYFKRGADAARRPITFLFNGGPGSASLWLHMGAFGPRRVVTSDDAHTPAAPYRVIDNPQSLLDASDLVFIDAPGTGFGRIRGTDAAKAFYGVDQDAAAFARFIRDFLSKYGRWNSPKYLFGESYGTMRGAVLAYLLEQDVHADLNGVIFLSQVLNWDIYPDIPEANPGLDLPYQLALPSFAATAWYHRKLPKRPAELRPLLLEVERFAMGEYALALAKGNSLAPARRLAIARKLHGYTGIPVSYILKSNLRINYGPFQKELLSDSDTTTGSLDTRFTGPTMDPLSKTADYDPQGSAISPAYVSAFNAYVRGTLKFGAGLTYKTSANNYGDWDFTHAPPGVGAPIKSLPNVMPDLAAAMKLNPGLKVLLNGGYYDVVTPYYEGWYEMHHLPIPPALQGNIEYKFYESGHMVYANEASLQALHDRVADFIRKTDNVE